MLGGQIKVYSQPNRGTHFVAVIPVESALPEYLSLMRAPSSTAIEQKLTALVVDDDKYNREINKSMLEKFGINCTDEAANG